MRISSHISDALIDSPPTNNMSDLAKLNLSCPFTWDIKKVLSLCTTSTNRNLDDFKFGGIPLITFLTDIVSAFESKEKDNDEDAARKFLNEAKTALEEVCRNKDTLDIARAVKHVYHATALYVCHRNNMGKEEDMDEKIVSISVLNTLERAALDGCKSFVLSLYHVHFVDEAIQLAEKAIEGNPKNALWHFVLGKCLRKKRRSSEGYRSTSSSSETESFKEASELSPHGFYKIYYIQAEHEASFNKSMSKRAKTNFETRQLRMYEDISRTCGDEPWILLKTVLGMLRCRNICNFDTVHSILDKVDELSKDNNVSFQYRGRAFRAQENYTKAVEYLKRAGEMGNFPASVDCLKAMLDTHTPAKVIIQYLMEMREKPLGEPADQRQQILFNLAIMYYTISDYKNSAKYILEAIETFSDSEFLKKPYKFSSVYMKNTSDFLREELLPKCEQLSTDTEFSDILLELRAYCNACDVAEMRI